MEIRFKTRVLGQKASERLRKHEVIQTIRSEFYPPGVHQVFLDGNHIGDVSAVYVDRRNLAHLSGDDASRGGFDSVGDLQQALRRAGYRFKRLDLYHAWRIRFEWCQTKEEVKE